MPLILRRIIFYLGLFLFLISAPLIIFYTAGFRYNFKQNKILKTGAIIINTDPKDASVFLNDRLRKETTPARLLNITPGEYSLRIAKNQYHSWQKQLKVESEQVTFVNDLILFKESSSQILIPGEIKDFIFEPSEKKLLSLKKENDFYEIWFRDETGELSLAWRSVFDAQPKFLYWTNKSNEVLLRGKESFLFTTKQPFEPLKNIEKMTQKTWKKIEFNTTQNLLLGLSNDNLYSINTKTGNTDLLEQKVMDFYPSATGIIILQKEEKESVLKTIGGNKSEEIKRLPLSDYEFRDGSPSWIALYDQKNNNLHLISRDGTKESVLAGTDIAWLNKSGPELLAYSDFEIWHCNLTSDSKELLSRMSEKIIMVLPHPLGSAYLAVTENSIRAFELDTRDRQNVYNLASFDKIYNAQIDKDGRFIYIAGIKDKTPGLWRLEIR